MKCPDDAEAEHGTVKRFGQGCECPPCAEAARPWREAAKRNRQPHGRLPVDLYLVGAEHGTANGGLVYGCGCSPCGLAASDLARARQAAYQARKRAGRMTTPAGRSPLNHKENTT